jgi:hypothetical protein
VLVSIDFIEDSIVNQLAEDGLVATSHAVAFEEERMALRLLHYVV